MKKSLLPGLILSSVFLCLVTLSSGCIVRPIGYGGYYPHHHHHGYWGR